MSFGRPLGALSAGKQKALGIIPRNEPDLVAAKTVVINDEGAPRPAAKQSGVVG